MEPKRTESTKRLAKNTLFLYFRSFVCLVLSIYSSRLILHALGFDDYGINNVVAGFASMFTLVTGSLSSSISRFLTYEQGTGDRVRQKQVFSISVTLMIGFSVIIMLLALSVGEWYMQTKMSVPPGRETAAKWAFYCAIISVITSLLATPYNAAIVSHERMGFYAFVNILEAILRLGLALYLTFGSYSVDRLILYTTIWTLCSILFRLLAAIYARCCFQECRFRLYLEKNLFRSMFSFAGWNFLSNASGTISGQGTNLLINHYYGPAVNAARGLSDTVYSAVSMFVNNFTVALSPQITKAYATGDNSYTKYLVFKGSRFAYYVLFLFSLPLILEARFVFTLWLGEVPEHTINFNRLALIANLLVVGYSVFTYAQYASGEIRNFNIVMSIITLLILPASWFLLRNSPHPEMIYCASIAAVICNIVVTHYFVSRTLKYRFKEVFKGVYLPEIKVTACASILPLLATLLLPYGWMRFLISGSLCVLCTVPSVLFIGCDRNERLFILAAARRFISRFKPNA